MTVKQNLGRLSKNVASLKDRYHYFKSGNIPKTEGGLILPHPCTQSYDLHYIK